MIPFRLYGVKGCPHCVEAAEYLRQSGARFDMILVNGDPIIDAGIIAMTHISPAPVPILVSFISKDIVVGFKRPEYDRMVSLWRSRNGAGVPDMDGGQVRGDGPSASVSAIEQTA